MTPIPFSPSLAQRTAPASAQGHRDFNHVLSEEVRHNLFQSTAPSRCGNPPAQLHIWHFGTWMQAIVGAVKLNGTWTQRALEGGIWCKVEDMSDYLRIKDITSEPEILILSRAPFGELQLSERWEIALGLTPPTNHDVTPPELSPLSDLDGLS